MLLFAVGAILLFAWPGWLNTTVFDQQRMQQDVLTVLVNKYKVTGVEGDVHCPDGESIETGNSFHCQVTVDGKPKQVVITVRDGKTASYDVSRPQ